MLVILWQSNYFAPSFMSSNIIHGRIELFYMKLVCQNNSQLELLPSTFTHMHTHTYESMHTHTCKCTHTQTHMQAQTHTHTHTHMQVRAHTHTHTLLQSSETRSWRKQSHPTQLQCLVQYSLPFHLWNRSKLQWRNNYCSKEFKQQQHQQNLTLPGDDVPL